ncbi:MAG: DUF2339 domain-containing protein [Woeseiaceae bacterium]|nr:DUF2339 domain-containing protein [Woeseiaceae bacterium]
MNAVWLVVGAFLGALIGAESGGFFGLLAGAAVAYLLSANAQLQNSVRQLADKLGLYEQRLGALQDAQRQLRQGAAAPPEAAPPQAEAAESPRPAGRPAPPPLDDPDRYGTQPALSAAADDAGPFGEREGFEPPPRAASATAQAAMAGAATQQGRSRDVSSPVDDVIGFVRRWLTTGNVPVKLGVLVSFFGVAFLLKYAVDNRVINIPIEARYLFVAAAAVVLLVLGWRLKTKQRVYALSLQGGGIGILFLTIYAAFSLHGMLSPGFAFFLMVLVTIAAGVLAVLQDARALAILGIVGGFLSPVLVSTGSGNHVALFSYYLVLNAAILGIAWHRAWRSLNIIGFAFTFGIGSLWGYESYAPEKFATTEPFLIAYFVFYTAIAILFAFRQPPKLRGVVDGTLVFGTPALSFALQSIVVDHTEHGLTISAAVAAVYYAGLALWLRTRGEQMALLVQSFVALAVAFATVAVPLALDDRLTAVAWALEGAALVWIGVRQQGLLAKLTGTALAFAGGIMFLDHGWTYEAGIAVFNANVMSGALLSVAALFSARLLATDRHPVELQGVASVTLMLWGLGWWFSTGSMEILDRADPDATVHLLLAFVTASFAALAFGAQTPGWIAARRTSLAYLGSLPLCALGYLLQEGHFLYDAGYLTWPLALLAHLYILRLGEEHDRPARSVWHYAGALFFSMLLAYEAYYLVDDANLSEVWAWSATLAVMLGIAAALVFGEDRLRWPLAAHAQPYGMVAITLLAFELTLLLILSVNSAGDPSPLSYVPILNPLDTLTILSLLLALHYVTDDDLREDRLAALRVAWAGSTFVLSTLMVVRTVYHFSNLVWNWDVLLDADSVQSALSIYWAILGLGGMIFGARIAHRQVWMAGVVLMLLVVAKLFLIDFGNTGTVARIVSFIGVGVLLLIVGYFAPAPPRRQVMEASKID